MGAPADSIEIQNAVASTGIGQELDLEALATDLPGVDFNPDNVPGVVYRMNDPEVVSLLFGSGTVVITGGKTVDNASVAVGRIVDRIDAVGLPG